MAVTAGKAIGPRDAWDRLQRGDLQIIDLRTDLERRRFGRLPGARAGSVLTAALHPRVGSDVAYLCQHAVRSKLPRLRGATEIEGGWRAWTEAGLPVEHR